MIGYNIFKQNKMNNECKFNHFFLLTADPPLFLYHLSALQGLKWKWQQRADNAVNEYSGG